MVLSSCVYNMSNYIVRQQIINKEKIYSYMDLRKKLQKTDDYKLLGRSYALPKIQKYSETVPSFFKLIKSKTQKHVGLPMYYKNRKTNTTLPSNLVFDGIQFEIFEKNVRIPLSHPMRKKHSLKNFKIKYNGVLRYKGKQGRSEIVYKDKQFYLLQSVEIPDVEPQQIVNAVGVDLGIKRLISFHTSNGNSLTIGSNRYFKQWQHYNILIANEQQYLSYLNRKSSNKLKRLFSRRKKYQKQLFDNIIKSFYKKMIKHQVQQIFIGDVKGIRDSGSKGKVTNSMINNYWSYNVFYNKLQCKAEELGITFIKITEEYTSQTCPECGFAHQGNNKDRDFQCKECGYSEDRDIVGAKNILQKGMYGSLQNIHRNEVVPLEVSV